MQELLRAGKDSDVHVGLRLVNKHNGTMAIITDTSVSDYGTGFWAVQKHGDDWAGDWRAELIIKHFYLCTVEEYRQLLTLTRELAAPDAGLTTREGVVPIKSGSMRQETLDAVAACPTAIDSRIFRLCYNYIQQDANISYVEEVKPVVVKFRLKLNSDDEGELTGYQILCEDENGEMTRNAEEEE